MKRGEDVFFFTLIDFLLQVFFFGLLLFVAWQVQQQGSEGDRAREESAEKRLLEGVGVSNIAELTDLLTKMVPLENLRGTSDYMARNGGIEKAKAAVDAVNAAGGAEKLAQYDRQVKQLTARVSELEGGWGKASCLPNISVNGKLQPKSVARVLVDDNLITLEDPTQEMQSLLSSHGLEYSAVQKLTPAAFRTAFAPVVARQPECRFFLSVTTRTQYLEPMRAVWSAFRTQ